MEEIRGLPFSKETMPKPQAPANVPPRATLGARYALRKRMDAGKSSTVRKLARAARIAAGMRPYRYETKKAA